MKTANKVKKKPASSKPKAARNGALPPFGTLLEAIDQLPLDDQEDLLRVIQSRVHAEKHDRFVRRVEEGRREYDEGKTRVMTVAQIMASIDA